MMNNNKDKSIENTKSEKQEMKISKKKPWKNDEGLRFPQEHEEQQSMNLRMKPQPLDKSKKK
jgi:hypothetical protein